MATRGRQSVNIAAAAPTCTFLWLIDLNIKQELPRAKNCRAFEVLDQLADIAKYATEISTSVVQAKKPACDHSLLTSTSPSVPSSSCVIYIISASNIQYSELSLLRSGHSAFLYTAK